MNNNILGKRIELLRNENNLNQLELAKILNIGNTTLSQYESGKRIPSDDIKLKIADYFNVSLDWLLGKSDIRNPYENSNPTIAAHRADGYDTDLPEDAKQALREYIDFLRQKYKKKE